MQVMQACEFWCFGKAGYRFQNFGLQSLFGKARPGCWACFFLLEAGLIILLSLLVFVGSRFDNLQFVFGGRF